MEDTRVEGAGGTRKLRADKPKQRSIKPATHIRHKKPPKRLSHRPNDVYINRNSQFAQQLARCHQLLEKNFEELAIHGLGSAIHRAINMALQLKETSPYQLTLAVTTSTVQLLDELEPVDDEGEFSTHSRPSSAVHITLRKAPPPLPSATTAKGSSCPTSAITLTIK